MNTQAPDQRAPNFAPWRAVYPSDAVGKALTYSLEQPVEPIQQNAVMRAIGQQGPEVGWWLGGVWCLLIVPVALLTGTYTDNLFTLFINGQCVGRYWGWGSDLPQSGQVGVYVGGTNGPVTFSDLLIAPA